MPNPNFMPVIGSSFDADAAQQQFYAGFNAQVERENLARQTAAADKTSAYNMQVSEAQRSDAARQAALDEAAARDAITLHTHAADHAYDQYKFGIQTDLTRNDQRINEAHYKWVNEDKAAKEKQITDATDDTAKNLAPQAKDLAAKMQDSYQATQQALVRAETLKSKLQSELSGSVALDKTQKQFVPLPNSDATIKAENEKKALDANNQLAAALAEYQTHNQDYTTHASAFENIRRVADRFQLQLNADGTIHNPWTKKNYGLDPTANPLTPPTPADVPDTTTQPANPFSGNMNVNLQTDATAGTGTSGYQFSPPDMTSVGSGVQSPVAAPVAAPVVPQPAPTPVSGLVPSAKAILFLHQHPETQAAFDAKYGQGSAAKILKPGMSLNPMNVIRAAAASDPSLNAAQAAGSYMWNSGPVQAVRSIFQPGQPDPAMQNWIHDAPAQ